MDPWYRIAFIPITVLIFACGSGREEENYQGNKNTPGAGITEDTLTLTTPPNSNFSVGPVYVDRVIEFVQDNESRLKISGMLPDGCSELYDVALNIEGQELHLSLKSWRPADAMCTQALIDFTYISDAISAPGIQNVTHYVIDGEKSELRTIEP